MSCRHDFANGTCVVCYPATGTYDPGPGPHAPNLDGPGAVLLDEVRVIRVVEYVGTRERVDEILRRSIAHVFVERDITITAARLDENAAINSALNKARAESVRLTQLTSDACAALGWARPQSATERSNAAADAAAALDAKATAPLRWTRGGVAEVQNRRAQWQMFAAKVRELNEKANAQSNTKSKGMDDAQDRR